NIGRIAGPYRYEDGTTHPHRRAVEGLVTDIPRTSFSQPALNEIGSALTLFQVRRHATEFLRIVEDAGHAVPHSVAIEEPEHPDLEPLRALSDEYLRALRTGDSVFTPGEHVWTLANSRELERVFVDSPDETGRSFDEKLQDQLADASDGALQLFAEAWCLNLAPVLDYTPATKRRLLEDALARMDEPATLPEVVGDALDTGAFNGGVAFKTRRFFQLALLIRLASRLLSMPEDERAEVLGDPHAFETVLESVPDPNEPAQR